MKNACSTKTEEVLLTMKIDGIEILCDRDIRRALLLKFLKFADQLGLSYSAITLFNSTIEEDMELVKQGKGSTVVVASRIYTICLLSGERRTQKRISIAMHCSIGALSKLYREVRKKSQGREIELDVVKDGDSPQAFWFMVNKKYHVRIDKKTKEASCECLGDIFKQGGRNQRECNHIQRVRKILRDGRK